MIKKGQPPGMLQGSVGGENRQYVAQYIKFLATDLTAFTLSSKNLLCLLQKLYCATFQGKADFIISK